MTGISRFADVEKDERFVSGLSVVLFTTESCAKCRLMERVLTALVSEHQKVSFFEVDLLQDSAVADRFGIRGAPTVGIFAQGRLEEMLVGAQPRGAVHAAIEPYLASN